MANVKIFAGFDVSKKFFDVCVLNEGKQQLAQRFGYDTNGLDALIKVLPVEAHCVMEVTGPYYLKLATWLYDRGFKVSVVNPLVIKRFSQMRLLRAKTDKADARMIADYAKTEKPEYWQPPAAYIIKLQQLDALQQQLQKQRTALLCQEEAFTASGMMDKEIKQVIKKSIDHLDKQLKLIDGKMEAIIEQEHGQMVNNITSIPGLGKKAATMLIVLSGGFSKFTNYKQMSAYVGLSPRIYESGTSVRGRAKICKMGMSRVRAILYVCAWSAKRYNKACRELYERLVAKGKSGRLALIAVANKLIKQAFAVATKNQLYQENIIKNVCF